MIVKSWIFFLILDQIQNKDKELMQDLNSLTIIIGELDLKSHNKSKIELSPTCSFIVVRDSSGQEKVIRKKIIEQSASARSRK